METKKYFSAFNEKYFEFLTFLKKNSNNNKDFSSFYNKNFILKNTNIKYIIKTWYSNITMIYYNDIMNDNISFFLKKDYHSDVHKLEDSSNNILKYINIFKENYNTFDKSIIQLCIDYIKQLTQISFLYYNKNNSFK